MSVQEFTDKPVVAPRASRETVERRLVWEGGVVEIGIPPSEKCKDGGFEDIRYIQFGRLVSPRNILNVFVHGHGAREHCGRKILGEIEIHLKRLADGDCYHHINIRPTQKPATHRFKVKGSISPILEKGVLRFAFERPQVGEIILIPLEGGSTGDEVLDRLIAAGWNITEEVGRKVTLSKQRDGRERTMTHHKPKQ